MKNIILSFTFGLISIFGYSQVQVGSGNDTNQQAPLGRKGYYTTCQSIYLASEINTSGNITSIQWYYAGTGTLSNSEQIVLYLGHTTKNSFASNIDWVSFNNLQLVYSGGITTNSTPGWKTLTFQTPFNYNGTDNLVVAVDENMTGTDTSSIFWNTQVESIRSIGWYESVGYDFDYPPGTAQAGGIISAKYVPTVKFGGITPPCVTSYEFSITNLTPTGATLNWTASNPAPSGGSEYYVSTSNNRPDSNITPTGTVPSGSNSAIISSLSPNTTYYTWVRNNCGGEKSSWSEFTSFKTLCNPISHFHEYFDNVTTPNLPDCWTKIIRKNNGTIGTLTKVETTTASPSYVLSGNTCVDLYNHNSTGDFDVILVSPYLSNLSAKTNVLRFNSKSLVKVQVGTVNSNRLDAIFTPVEELTLNGSTLPYFVDFTLYNGSDSFIAFRINDTSMKHFYVDNIVWETKTNCGDVSNIIVSETYTDGAKIDWTASSSGENRWDIVIGRTSVSDPSTLTPIRLDTNTYTASGLDSNTPYNVWIRSSCETENGYWIGPITFRTNCSAVSDFFENFDSTPSNVSIPQNTNAIPICWSRINRNSGTNSIIRAYSSNGNYNSPLNSLQLQTGNSPINAEIIAISPEVDNLSLGNHRFTFYGIGKSGSGVIQIGTLDNNSDTGIFTPLTGGEITLSGTMTKYVIPFTSYTGSDRYIGIKIVSDGTTSNQVWIDDVTWEINYLCGNDVKDVVISNKLTNSATVTWTPTGQETSWDIAVGNSTDTDPTLLSFESTTTSGSFTITTLSPNTTYNVWVRSSCANDKGKWIGPVTFTTNCNDITDFNEDFEGLTNGSVPECWTAIVRGSGLQTGASVGASSGEIKLFNANSTSNYDLILVSPPLSNVGSGDHRLKFTSRGVGVPFNIEVGTLNNNTDAATFTPLPNGTISLENISELHKVYFDQIGGSTDKYVGIRLKVNSGYKTAYIGNMIWEQSPACPDVTGITVPETTTSSATITWDINGSNEWDVVVGDVSISDPNSLPIHQATGGVNAIEVTGLNAASPYKVWVRSSCNAGKGDWIGPVYFNSNCYVMTDFEENFDSATLPYLPPCWNKIIRNAASNSIVATNYYLSSTSKPNVIQLYGSSSNANADIILVSPQITSLNTQDLKLSFWASGGNPIEVGTLNNATDTAVFTPITKIDTPNGEYIVPLNYSGSNKYIGFRLVCGEGQPSDKNCALDTIKLYSSLGNSDFDLNGFTYYPNPIKDVLNISYVDSINSVSVYNLLGEELITKTINNDNASINTSDLSSGVYLVKINFENYIKTIKVIKE